MTFQVILTIHVILALTLITLILLQHGKGADAGAAFGSGSAGSVFGAGGSSSFLYKLTIAIATGFLITSIAMAYIASSGVKKSEQNNKSIIQKKDIPALDLKQTIKPKSEIPK